MSTVHGDRQTSSRLRPDWSPIAAPLPNTSSMRRLVRFGWRIGGNAPEPMGGWIVNQALPARLVAPTPAAGTMPKGERSETRAERSGAGTELGQGHGRAQLLVHHLDRHSDANVGRRA